MEMNEKVLHDADTIAQDTKRDENLYNNTNIVDLIFQVAEPALEIIRLLGPTPKRSFHFDAGPYYTTVYAIDIEKETSIHYVDVNMRLDDDEIIRRLKDGITTVQDLLGSIRAELGV